MKWNKLFSIFAVFSLTLTFAFCSSAEKKKPAEEPVQEEVSEEDTTTKDRSFDLNILEEINITLKEYRYPDGVRRRGFSYKKADVLKDDFNLWAKENINFIREALDRLPEDYVLEITGHADTTGPEEPEGEKKGNIYYSQIRADAVKEALVKQGIPANRIVTVAAGSSQPISGYDGSDAINRRVTFQVRKAN